MKTAIVRVSILLLLAISAHGQQASHQEKPPEICTGIECRTWNEQTKDWYTELELWIEAQHEEWCIWNQSDWPKGCQDTHRFKLDTRKSHAVGTHSKGAK